MALYPYHLSITSSTTSDYGYLLKGFTDGVLIVGFADVDSVWENEVYPVSDINQAFLDFRGSTTYNSTCIQGMLEAYQAGARDIYLFSIGDMASYTPPEDRDASFYTGLLALYESALPILMDCDDVDFIVPYDARPQELDFVTPFGESCEEAGPDNYKLCIFSYNGDSDAEFTGDNKYIVLVDGYGLFAFRNEFDNAYMSGMAPTFAGLLSKLSTDVPPDNRMIGGVRIFNSEFDGTEETLEEAGIVGFRKTVGYKRAADGTLKTTLCNTRADEDSDYRMVFAGHCVQRFLKGIRELDLIGTVAVFAEEVIRSFFDEWILSGYARDIGATFRLERYELYVDVILYMYHPIGAVEVSFIVGPVY